MFASPIGSAHLRVSGGGGKSGYRKSKKKAAVGLPFVRKAFPNAQSDL